MSNQIQDIAYCITMTALIMPLVLVHLEGKIERWVERLFKKGGRK